MFRIQNITIYILRYAPNHVIHQDLQVTAIKEVMTTLTGGYQDHQSDHLFAMDLILRVKIF